MKACLSEETYPCQWKDAKRWPITEQCCPHVETSQMICSANHFTGLYLRRSPAVDELIIKTLDINTLDFFISNLGLELGLLNSETEIGTGVA